VSTEEFRCFLADDLTFFFALNPFNFFTTAFASSEPASHQVEISGLSSEQWQENTWNMGIRRIIENSNY